MPTFFGVIHRTSSGEFSVAFPDCAGCMAVGQTFTEAELRAAEVLQHHLEAMDTAGEKLPRPSNLARIKSNPACRGGVVIAVPVTARLRRPSATRLRSLASSRPRGRKAAPPTA
jgi:predicted RNase H-like HicB family nuclease